MSTEGKKLVVFFSHTGENYNVGVIERANTSGELDFTYYNAVYTVENSLSKVTDEKGMKRVEKFLKSDVCPGCHGTRLSEKAHWPRIVGIGLDVATEKTLTDAVEWVKKVPETLPEEMRKMANAIGETFILTARRLEELGLGYLTLDRATSTLSTGERQRMALARVVRNRTTGVMYVLDEPSIGLHPANNVGLIGVMRDLVGDGNSVLLVVHDAQILRDSDYIIEMRPEAGAKGGKVIAQGTVKEIENDPESQIGPFSLPELMDNDVAQAIEKCSGHKLVDKRLKLASEMGCEQGDALFVFDEPTIGLHPLDVHTLLGVFQRLIDFSNTSESITGKYL